MVTNYYNPEIGTDVVGDQEPGTVAKTKHGLSNLNWKLQIGLILAIVILVILAIIYKAIKSNHSEVMGSFEDLFSIVKAC